MDLVDKKRLEELEGRNCGHQGPCYNVDFCQAGLGELYETLSLALKVIRITQEFIGDLQPQNALAYEQWKPLKKALAPFSQGEKEPKE